MQFKVEAEGEEKERRKKMKIVHYRYTEEYKLKELLEAYKEGRRTYYKPSEKCGKNSALIS